MCLVVNAGALRFSDHPQLRSITDKRQEDKGDLYCKPTHFDPNMQIVLLLSCIIEAKTTQFQPQNKSWLSTGTNFLSFPCFF